MNKIMLVMTLLISTAFAEYIPNEEDRDLKRVCQAFIDGKSKKESDIILLGLMYGAVDMALMAHYINGEDVVRDRSRNDLVVYSCQKAMKDKKSLKDIGFRGTFYFHVYLATVKH